MRVVGILVVWLAFTSAAWAADDPATVAAEASEARDAYCSDASDDAVTLQAEGTAQVSSVWARVSRSYDAHKTIYLLYWRALLGQCLDKTDLVQQDLETFVAAVKDDPAYSEQVRDAERRLRRIQVVAAAEGVRVDPRPGIGIGIGAAAAGGVLGGLAAWQGNEMARLNAEFHSGTVVGDSVFDDVRAAGETAETTSNALTAVAVGAGTAGIAVLTVSIAISARQPKVAGILLPTPDGMTLALVGRW